jgi:6-pyruvoyltetrahydropterin/6-carboxytetrahydropterin synthase
VRIWREYAFEAAHRLPLVPEGHKCARMHGHSYRVEMHVEGPVGDDGMVLDYAEIDDAFEPLREQLDHACLNDLIDNPTAENLAIWIWDACDLPLVEVVVRETERSGCRYVG